MTDDEELWRQYESFHLKQGLGFWSPAVVTLPFGTLMIRNAADSHILWQGDLTRHPHREIIETSEDAARRWDNVPSFYLSPSWKGDVEGFRKSLQESGYTKKLDVLWLTLDNLDHVEDMPQSSCVVEITRDAKGVENVYATCFPERPDFAPEMGRHAAAPKTVVDSPVFAACDGDAVVGMVGAFHDGNFGYLYSLGVLPEYRNRGIGKHLVRQCLLHMKQASVRHVVCGVYAANAVALDMQKRAGYRVFAAAESWMKAT